jgi:hypothetical protein
MPNNITQIPAPRVSVIDANTGLMSREWYRFFINLFNLTGDGSNTISLTDLQVGPPSLDSFAASITYADVAPPIPTPTSVDDLAPRDELGTLAAKNSASLTADVSGILPTANGGTGQSTPTGIQFTNLTTTQKNAISSPATGLVIFDTTLAKLCVYSGSAWQTVTSV